MICVIAIETSAYSDSPTKRWLYGAEIWVEDVAIEYPDELDYLGDDELLELADESDSGVTFVSSDVQVGSTHESPVGEIL